MKALSRRSFVYTCLALAGAALTTGLDFLRGRNVQAVSNPGLPEVKNQGDTQTAPEFRPTYLELHKSGELKSRAMTLWKRMESCDLCPRQCGINRIEGDEGYCQATSRLEISSFHPHFGEERPLVGTGGSGTIFLTNCGLRCVFCINWEISWGGRGKALDVENMVEMMLLLQKRGCHNINFVTPTHYSPHILLAVDGAVKQGFRLPLVYNTCGWERLDVLRQLDGVVDIYLPDFKYAHGTMAAKYSSEAETYPEITKAALLEMNRQVGVARPAEDGLVYRGLMIRHLVMPNQVGGTRQIIQWIADNLPKDTYLNIMSQYTPTFKAHDYPEISRRITRKEFMEAVQSARDAGLTNLDIQRFRF